MRRDIYDHLPASLQALVDEIEAVLPLEIEVRSKADRQPGEIAEAMFEETAGCIIGWNTAIIEAPGAISAVTELEFAHELLHLRRSFVERVPHIYPKQARHGNAAAATDNWLEHAVIYDAQLALCPGFRPQLDESMIEFWEKAPWSVSGVNLRFNLLSRLMITRRYGSGHARAAASTALNRLSLPGASRAARECLAVMNDKRALVRRFLEFCELPAELFWLRRCEPSLGKNVWENL